MARHRHALCSRRRQPRIPYSPGHIADHYTLPESSAELVPNKIPPKDPGTPSVYEGHATLTPHPRERFTGLLSAFLDRLGPGSSDPRATLSSVAPAGSVLTLGGLTDALIMREPGHRFPIDDPLAFEEDRAFTQRLGALIGDEAQLGLRPEEAFHPLREGTLEIAALRIIDSFGQVQDLPIADVVGTPSLPADASGRLTLVPRVVPAARLHARFLAASQNSTAQGHPAASPICGWLLPNNLDRVVMVYDAEGRALGSVDDQRRWWPPPGQSHITLPDRIPNRTLSEVVAQLLHHDADWNNRFRDLLEAASEEIAPDSSAQHRALALLVGRPLAVVRVRLAAELLGAPPTDQGWPALVTRLRTGQRDDRGLPSVKLPVRVGSSAQLDDGVVGFWQRDQHGFVDDAFCVASDPNAPVRYSAVTGLRPQSAAPLTLTLDGDPTDLAVLLDPRGSLHLTTGALPTKTLRLPAAMFAAAMRRLSVTFLAAPLLTPSGPPQLPLGKEPGHQWAWLERTGDQWKRIAGQGLAAPILHATLNAPQTLREGWLELSPAPTEEST